MTLWHPLGELTSTEQTLLLGAAAADSKTGRVNLKSRCYLLTFDRLGRPNHRRTFKEHHQNPLLISTTSYFWSFCQNDAFASVHARKSSHQSLYFSHISESVYSPNYLTYRICWVVFNGLLLSSSLCGTGLHVLYRSKKKSITLCI